MCTSIRCPAVSSSLITLASTLSAYRLAGIVGLGVLAFVPIAHGAGAALPDKDAVVQVGFAQVATSLDEPMRLSIREKDPKDASKLIDRDVTVTDIPKYVRPTQRMGEAPGAYAARLVAAQEAHSKIKAERIAQAINTAIGMGRATVAQVNVLSATGTPAWNLFLGGAIIPIRNGQITIAGAHALRNGPSDALLRLRAAEIRAAKLHNAKPENANNQLPVPKLLVNNHTGEQGDGVRIRPGPGIPPPPMGSPGSRATMSSMHFDLQREFPGEFPGLPMVATGLDAGGNESVIELGILETYVASLNPAPGQTDEQVYLALESLLDSHGLPASYDSFSRVLSLDGSFDETKSLYWAATDTGFGQLLAVSFGSPVPEPRIASLLAAAMILIAWRRLRQRS